MSADEGGVESRPIFLSTVPPSRGQKDVAVAVVVVAVVLLAVAAPFARLPLPRVLAFIPAYESALAITDLLTAVLLFGQFTRLRSWSLLVLACGYLFNAAIVVPHMLTFPGVFAPDGLLDARSQTTAWLYGFWHGGFALFVLCYAMAGGRFRDGGPTRHDARVVIGWAVAAVLGLVVALTVLATAGHDLLPIIIVNGDYSRFVSTGVSPGICLISVLALYFLWRRRNVSILDLWLIVVVSAWLCDLTLSAIVGSARYDLGWYAGRSFGLLASSFVLGGLLLEMNRLYGDLSDALKATAARSAELLESRERLSHAQRLESIGRLTGGVAHDFNNMLQVIIGRLARVRRSAEAGSVPTARDLDALDYAAERSAKLTAQLLAFSRQQPFELKVVDMNKLVGEMGDILRQTLGEATASETVLAGGLWHVHVDPNQVANALLNLAINARDAMPDGGKLTIETANAFLDEAYAKAHADVHPGQYVVVTLSDTGCGMPPEVLARAFEPFFTTKSGGGTGLGLSMVFGVVKQSGGHVKIYSEVGAGTAVKVYLPRHHGTAALTGSGLPAPAERRTPRGRGETILIVEDEERVRSLAAETLRDLDYKVLQAEDGAQALTRLHDHPAVQLLLTDVGLPGGMNGKQLVDKVRALRPDLRIVFMTGYAQNAIVHHGRLDPGVDLLAKPFTQEALAAKIRASLDQSPLSPN